jgi:galactokinase
VVEVKQFFKKQFASNPVHVVQAPARLELLGNHTDYNEGLVLSLAVDKYLFMASSPRKDGRIQLVSSAFNEKEEFLVSDDSRIPAAPWTNYIKGILGQLRKRKIHFSGFNAAVHSTIPMGAGMSSSAALLVATALTVRKLNPFKLGPAGLAEPPKYDKRGELPLLTPSEKIELAKVCQAAENQFVGLNCGLLDPLSSLFGKAHHAMELDFKSVTVTHAPLLGDVAVIVCHSGVKHQLVDGEYNRLRQYCEAAARKLGAKTLRSIEPSFLAAHKTKLTEREHQCASHIVGEIQRVIFGERALREEDLAQFGQYMFQSHESSKESFQNSCPELDLLVDLARHQPGCLGARLTGGGFGGATINLVSRPQAENFMSRIAEEYSKKRGRDSSPMLCQIVDGAR